MGIQTAHFLHYSSRRYDDLVYFDSTTQWVMIARNNGKGDFTEKKRIVQSNSVSSFVVGNLNNDPLDDIVIIHREQNRIEVLLSTMHDSSYTSINLSAGYYPEGVTIGDITNDHIPDILCYGKLSSGITLFSGTRKGSFKAPINIFPDISISDVFIVSLNRDNVADIAIFNWFKNEVALYFGTGNLNFSEQTVLSFGNDSVQVLCDDFNNDDISDIAISSTQYKTLQIYHGDGLGTYTHAQTLTLSASPQELFSFRSASNTDNSIISENRSGNTFSLYLNRGEGKFYEEIVYGMDSSTTSLSIGNVTSSSSEDVVLLNNARHNYSVVWNAANRSNGSQQHYTIAVGKHPSSVFVTDINNDGRDDIIVTNAGSSTVSLLTSTGNGFDGQVSFETPETPVSVSLYSKTQKGMTFISVHKNNPRIGIITIQPPTDSSDNILGDIDIYSLPLPETPITVLPDISLFNKGISLYAFMASSTNAIVFYQQIRDVQFVSKSLVPMIPTKIIYSTINDLNNDGKADLLYLYEDIQRKKEYLGVTYNDSTSSYKGNVFTTALPDTGSKRAFLYVDDFNGDHVKDCLVYMSPQNTLVLFRGLRNGGFEFMQTIVTKAKIKSKDQLQLYDYDNDGVTDILYEDSENHKLLDLKGKGNGLFLNANKIASIPDHASFRCGDFNGDSVTDIVYTNPDGWTITVTYGKENTVGTIVE